MARVQKSCVTLFALIVGLLVGKASALSCNHCNSDTSWESCDRNSSVGYCDILLVNDLHYKLQELNEWLPLTPPFWPVSFRCYAIELQLLYGGGRVFERGCTYDGIDFCLDWNSLAVQTVVNCTVSEEGVPDVIEPNTGANGSPRMLAGGHSLLVLVLTIFGILAAGSIRS